MKNYSNQGDENRFDRQPINPDNLEQYDTELNGASLEGVEGINIGLIGAEQIIASTERFRAAVLSVEGQTEQLDFENNTYTKSTFSANAILGEGEDMGLVSTDALAMEGDDYTVIRLEDPEYSESGFDTEMPEWIDGDRVLPEIEINDLSILSDGAEVDGITQDELVRIMSDMTNDRPNFYFDDVEGEDNSEYPDDYYGSDELDDLETVALRGYSDSEELDEEAVFNNYDAARQSLELALTRGDDLTGAMEFYVKELGDAEVIRILKEANRLN